MKKSQLKTPEVNNSSLESRENLLMYSLINYKTNDYE